MTAPEPTRPADEHTDAVALDLDAIEAAALADDGWWSVPVLALVAEVRRLRRNLTATAQDATDAKCARDAARREADQLRPLLGSHADGHRCTCTMTDPGVYHGDNMHPPEWEQDLWCPTHPHMPYVIEEHRKALARAEAAEAEVRRLTAVDDDLSRQIHETGGLLERAQAAVDAEAEVGTLRAKLARSRSRHCGCGWCCSNNADGVVPGDAHLICSRYRPALAVTTGEGE